MDTEVLRRSVEAVPGSLGEQIGRRVAVGTDATGSVDHAACTGGSGALVGNGAIGALAAPNLPFGRAACRDQMRRAIPLTTLLQFALHAHGTEIEEACDALAQISGVRSKFDRSFWLAGAVGRRFKAAFDVLPDHHRITPGSESNGGDQQTLSVQVDDHEGFSLQDHPCHSRPLRIGRHGGGGRISTECGVHPAISGQGTGERNFDAHNQEVLNDR